MRYYKIGSSSKTKITESNHLEIKNMYAAMCIWKKKVSRKDIEYESKEKLKGKMVVFYLKNCLFLCTFIGGRWQITL